MKIWDGIETSNFYKNMLIMTKATATDLDMGTAICLLTEFYDVTFLLIFVRENSSKTKASH